MGKLLTLNFWFNLRPGHLSPTCQNILIVFLALLLITSITAFILKKNKKGLFFRFWEKILSFSSINLIIGLVLWFLNYELAPLLSAHFWYILWIISMIFWIYLIIKFCTTLPEKKQQIAEERAYKKYLP